MGDGQVGVVGFGGRRGLEAVAVGAGGEGAVAADTPAPVDGARPAQAIRWDPPRSQAALPAAAVAVGVGRDLAGSGGRSVASGDRRGSGPGAVHGVAREVESGGGRYQYRALAADRAAWARACRPKPTKLASRPGLASMVEEKLTAKWSPEQISGWLVAGSPTRRRCRCRTRRFTGRCSCRHVAICATS